MENSILRTAIQNNALWCDLVCRAHDADGEFFDAFWVNPYEVPLLYPNFITLQPFKDNEERLGQIHAFLKENRDRGISVKDSYGELELGNYDMKKIIEAEWIWLALERNNSVPENKWKKVTTKKELAMWCAAWSDGDRDLQDTFPSTLLEEGDVYFLGEFKNSQITKGAIVFQADDSIGVSNVFSQTEIDRTFWHELVENMRFNFPDMLLVGYEADLALKCAKDAGFESCGKLSIWAK